MSPIDQPAVPKGSTVLITGGNGFIGSNIADQLLKLGYKVRGTTRNPQKSAWVSNLFDRKYAPGLFELVAVPDMEADGAYDEVVKGKHPSIQPLSRMTVILTRACGASVSGVSAVIHTATNYTMNPNPHEVIPGASTSLSRDLSSGLHNSSNMVSVNHTYNYVLGIEKRY